MRQNYRSSSNHFVSILVVLISVTFVLSCNTEDSKDKTVKKPTTERKYDSSLSTSLSEAVLSKNIETTKTLLARNADPNALDKEGVPLLMAILLRMEFSLNDAVSGNISGDNKASETGLIVKLLLDAGANPNGMDKDKNPVLIAAFKRNDPTIVSDLIRAGASVKAANSSGSPLIIEAAFSGNLKIVELVIEAGADVNAKRPDGSTSLLAATYKGKWELSKYLIQKGADVNARIEVGTPLLFAVAGGDYDTVKMLVEKGADINAKDNQNNSPLLVAQKMKHTKIFDYLKNLGAKL